MASETAIPPWDIGMLGPSRVGKTSLLTAMRVATNSAFAGTSVIMQPADEDTKKAFADNDNLMHSELAAGRFHPDSLPGDLEESVYTMALNTGVDRHRLTLNFHDYPGGWLRSKSKRVSEILGDCPAVILPVDAAYVMESNNQHMSDVVDYLEVSEIADFVEEWAAARSKHGDLSRLIVAPVKCESYFTDNGGRIDMADALFHKVHALYEPVAAAYRRRSHPESDLLYAPVDTIGPIEVMDIDWKKNKEGRWRMTPTYRVRRGPTGAFGQRSVRGAEPILAHLVQDIIRAQEEALYAAESSLVNQAQRRSGWFLRLIDNVTGRTAQRRRDLESIRSDLGQLTEETRKLDRQEYGRVRPWA